MNKILVIHGPNLNLLGTREPETYGHDTLEVIDGLIAQHAAEYGLQVHCWQSNHEGAIIDHLQSAVGEFDGIVINPAAYTHYSIAIRDALAAVALPAVEVHLSDIAIREPFRRISVVRDVCLLQIGGYGKYSYVYGLEALLGYGIEKKLEVQLQQCQKTDAKYRAAVKLLHEGFPKFDWTGIYLVDGNELVLHDYIGAPTPHTRIPIGTGICGAAVAAAETIVVPDVQLDPRYLACSLETKSEIVVPIYHHGSIIGEIDIDSHRPDAFKPHDRWYLERIAKSIGASL